LLTTVAALGERALIARITARLPARPWVIVGPGDDAAVVEPERGTYEVLTTDVQVEGVHFDRRFVPPDAIGHRALAVNLSDLAAMGARPRSALLSMVLPDTLDVAVVDGVLDGLLALADRHHLAVIGGNISRSPGPLMVDITATGTVRPRRILMRAGAHPGDGVFVTGTLGDAMAGLGSLQEKCAGFDAQKNRYLRPEPRLRAGMLLGRNRAATSCMDLSDGLADGLRQIAEASNVGISFDADALPVSDGVRAWHVGHGRDPVAAAIEGGDDYELLFTARGTHQGRLKNLQRGLGDLLVTKIGVVTRDERLVVRSAAGERELTGGYEHFRS
jgi:thiamine-monophosphate kinase